MIRFISITSVAFAIAVGPLLAGGDDVKLGKTSMEWIVILKKHEKLKFRQAALIIMESYGPQKEGVVPAVIYALEKDKEVVVRRAAAQTLGRMGPEAKGAATALGEVLVNRKEQGIVREAAARALGGDMTKESHKQVLALAKALSDPHEGTRIAAAETLLELNDKAIAALPQLKEVVADAKAPRFARIYAIQIVSKYEDPDAGVPLLRKIIASKKEHRTIHVAAMRGLGEMGAKAENAVADVAAMIRESKDKSLRREALITLGKMGDKAAAAWPTIQKTFKDGDAAIRNQAIRFAGAFAKVQPAAIEQLVNACAKDEAVENQLAAIQELGALGPNAGPEALKVLQKLAATAAENTIRNAARAAVSKIAAKPKEKE